MVESINKLPNCTVHLEGRYNTITGTTDEDGNITFEEVLPDVYTMVINKEGYEEYTYPEPIEIIEGKLNKKVLNITLEEKVDPSDTSRTIKIKLSPEVPDAQVTLTNVDDSENSLTENIVFTPNDDNNVIIKNVEFGTYQIKVTCDGYVDYTQTITVNKSNNNPRNIAINLTEEIIPTEDNQDDNQDNSEEDVVSNTELGDETNE